MWISSYKYYYLFTALQESLKFFFLKEATENNEAKSCIRLAGYGCIEEVVATIKEVKQFMLLTTSIDNVNEQEIEFVERTLKKLNIKFTGFKDNGGWYRIIIENRVEKEDVVKTC